MMNYHYLLPAYVEESMMLLDFPELGKISAGLSHHPYWDTVSGLTLNCFQESIVFQSWKWLIHFSTIKTGVLTHTKYQKLVLLRVASEEAE